MVLGLELRLEIIYICLRLNLELRQTQLNDSEF